MRCSYRWTTGGRPYEKLRIGMKRTYPRADDGVRLYGLIKRPYSHSDHANTNFK